MNNLGMEVIQTGSELEKIIGIGQREFKPTGEFIPMVDFFYSYFRRMVRTFEQTPVVKQFGLSIDRALALPVNQWYEIERQAKILAERPVENKESELFELMKELIEVMKLQNGG